MRLMRPRGTAWRLMGLFGLVSLVAVAAMAVAVLMLDREARRSRADEASRRDLQLIEAKLKARSPIAKLARCWRASLPMSMPMRGRRPAAASVSIPPSAA